MKWFGDYLYKEYKRIEAVQTPYWDDASWFERIKYRVFGYLLKDRLFNETIKYLKEELLKRQVKERNYLRDMAKGAITNNMTLEDYKNIYLAYNPNDNPNYNPMGK